jgi:outer membrane protein
MRRKGNHLSPVMLAFALAGALVLGLASCTSLSPVHVADYVGPGAAQPAAVPPAPPPPPEAPLPLPRVPASGPVQLSISDAVLLALAGNETFRVERYGPSIAGTFVDEMLGAFDPAFNADLSWSKTVSTRVFGQGLLTAAVRTLTGTMGLTQYLPSGTTFGMSVTGTLNRAMPGGTLGSTRVGLSVSQHLLQGFGTDVNLVSVRQARIDAQTSQYVLRGYAQALVAQVEESYWDYLLAEREIDIYAQSLKLAEDQLAQTRELIKVGRLADTEAVSAEATGAQRRQDLIGGRTALETARLDLLRLVNPDGRDQWGRQIVLTDRPAIGQDELGSVEDHAAEGLRMRPDLNEARLQVQRGELDVVKTKNGLLPVLDAFLTLGKSGYSSSFPNSMDVLRGPGKDIAAGLDLEVPIGNRAPEARQRRAVFSLSQAKAAVDNMEQLVQVDVRTAFATVVNARQAVDAATATRKLQEEKLKVEQEKLRVGRSTTLLVAQAQDDLLASQISEVQATIAHMKALTELHRLDGSLLARRGISAPGDQAVDISKPRQW